jgi:hypothetical protein
MPPDRRGNRVEQPRRLADPVTQSRTVEFQAFAGRDLALAIEREMIDVLRHQQMRKRRRGGAAARRWQRRRWPDEATTLEPLVTHLRKQTFPSLPRSRFL